MNTRSEARKGWEIHGLEATPEAAAKHAISLLGGARRAAQNFGLTTQAIYQWERIPADRVLQIEAMLDGKVTRYQMRPDIFGPPL